MRKDDLRLRIDLCGWCEQTYAEADYSFHFG